MSRSVCERPASTTPVSSWDFNQVYVHYREPIYRRIIALVGNPEEAADLTQETFLRAFKALPKMTGILNISAWLYRIATNVAYDTLRHRQLIRWESVEELLYEPTSCTEDDDPQTRYNGPHELIRLALERIPDRYRLALQLYLEEGYNYVQLAQALHIAPSGVKMYLTRARRHFKQHFAELEQEVTHV